MKRKELLTRGLCGCSTGRPIVEGKKRCAECLDREKLAARKRRDNPEGLAKEREAQKKYRDANKAYNVLRNRKYGNERKLVVMTHYGGRCVCCGESGLPFLSIDHKNGDGAEQRRSLQSDAVKGKRPGSGSPFYQWIIRNNFPDDLQILCHNCNLAKGRYSCCPHQMVLPSHPDQLTLFGDHETNT